MGELLYLFYYIDYLTDAFIHSDSMWIYFINKNK